MFDFRFVLYLFYSKRPIPTICRKVITLKLYRALRVYLETIIARVKINAFESGFLRGQRKTAKDPPTFCLTRSLLLRLVETDY